MDILKITDLTVSFGDSKNAVTDVTLHLGRNETIGIVGESGSGKSILVKSILNLLPKGGYIKTGKIEFNGKNLTELSGNELRKIRGKEISMIFQDPMTSLNPLRTIGFHLTEVIERFSPLRGKSALKKAAELLESVGIINAGERLKEYPHEFSGGMRQRVLIAMAISSIPEIIIADEPTTALDVTIQAQILTLLKNIQEERKNSLILITHDLGIIKERCDRIYVIYAGKIMEEGKTQTVIENPRHYYTKALLRSIPPLKREKNERLIPIPGMAPSPGEKLNGCPFYGRCERGEKICGEINPPSVKFSEGHISYCHFAEELNMMCTEKK